MLGHLRPELKFGLKCSDCDPQSRKQPCQGEHHSKARHGETFKRRDTQKPSSYFTGMPVLNCHIEAQTSLPRNIGPQRTPSDLWVGGNTHTLRIANPRLFGRQPSQNNRSLATALYQRRY